LDRRVSEETLAGIAVLAKNMVPLVPFSKIKVNVIRVSPPAKSLNDWLKDNSTVLATLAITLLLGLGIYRARKGFSNRNRYFYSGDFGSQTEAAAPFETEEKVRAETKVPPEEIIVENTVEIKPEQETAEFKSFSNKNDFPEEIILEIPSQLAELAFSNLSPGSKAGLLAVMTHLSRIKFINRVTEEGSKLRAFLQIEVENCLNDYDRLRQYQMEKNELAWTFAAACAEILRSRPDFSAELSPEVEAWILENAEGHTRNAA
jgi:hypothetical protein